MKIDKAIELSIDVSKSLRDHKFPDYADAIQLGIEALTYIIRQRATSFEHRQAHLPSEDS